MRREREWERERVREIEKERERETKNILIEKTERFKEEIVMKKSWGVW